MLYLLCTLLIFLSSSLSNFYLISLNIISFSMMWLVGGAIFVCVLSFSLKTKILWSFMVFILSLSFFSSSLFFFYLMFELSLIPILLMILFVGNQPERLSAALYFLIYTAFLSIPFLAFAIFLIKTNFQFYLKMNFSVLFSYVVLAPFLVKMPVFGLHFWLPKAHVEANTSGSMILAGVLLKLGSYGIIRMVFSMKIFIKNSSFFWLSLAILSSIFTFFQNDIKKLVAFSSVTHMTFMMVGLMILNKMLLISILLLSLAHGWGAMAMFAAAGTSSSVQSSRLNFLLSSDYKMSWFILLFGVALLSNASLPPFPSFFSESLILSSLMSKISSLVFMFLLISMFVCYYNVYLFSIINHFKPVEMNMLSTLNSEYFKFFFLSSSIMMSLTYFLIFS